MFFRRHTRVTLTLIGGQVIAGKTSWSWKWRTMRLIDATAFTERGEIPAAGAVYIPRSSILLVVVTDG